MITVAIVDDHALFRSGLRALLTAAGDIEVVGEADTAATALPMLAECSPMVAIIDSTLPDVDGAALCSTVRSTHPTIACLMLDAEPDHETLLAAIVADAAAYLPKTPRGDGIVEAVRDLAAGRIVIGRALAPRPRTHPPRRRQTNGRHR